MIPVEEHAQRILAAVRRLPPQRVPVELSAGLVLAEDVRAEVDLPGFTNSAMDGYAVRVADLAGASDDTPVTLTVVSDIPAGDRRRLTIPPGDTARIMTGAPVPQGAEAVVPVELTDGGTERVTVRASVQPGQHVRRAGDDLREGDVVLRAGTRLGPRQVALAAAAGLAELVVTPRPRVVVLSTGDELVPPGQRPGFGEVVDSNGLMVLTALEHLGMQVASRRSVADDADRLRRMLEETADAADAIVTTGGVSAGAYDTVKAVLSETGTVRFDKVAMQPGMPQGFGLLRDGRVPVFTLPGNPVSAMVSFEVFVAPALRVMAGRSEREEPLVEAAAEHDWTSPAGKLQFARVELARVDGGLSVRLVGAGQGSHILGGLADANALALVPPDTTQVVAGDVLRCHLLGPIMER